MSVIHLNLNEFKIIPIAESAKRLKISDDEYFSPAYGQYISNSRLKYIDPKENGSIGLFRNPPKFTTSSLYTGSCVHQRVLQPEEFSLAEKMNKPTAKLGQVVDKIIQYRKDGESIYESIKKACAEVGYYANTWESKIPEIIKKGFAYYMRAKDLEAGVITLDDKSYDVVTSCIASLENNKAIMNKLHPYNIFGDPIASYNEDALFLDFAIIYKSRATILKVKGKLDNWCIDEENKLLTINDLKTSGHYVDSFMRPEGSLFKYSYYRQAGLYKTMLEEYAKKEYGYNYKWNFEFNFLVVQTIGDYSSACYRVSDALIEKGKQEYEDLLKRVAAYQMFGENAEIEFFYGHTTNKSSHDKGSETNC